MSQSRQQGSVETVVLVHGLWMHGLVMQWMARQLRREGFAVRVFSYRSVLRSPAENADRLAPMLRRIDGPIVHLVAHSLGGIIVMHLLNRQTNVAPGRIVLLGSPVRGSHVAFSIMRLPLIRTLFLGKSIHRALLGGAPSFSGQRELGVICGDKALGFGRLFMQKDAPNDGTVFVTETALEHSRDSIEMPVTHTSMLFSKAVVKQISGFLKNGTFN